MNKAILALSGLLPQEDREVVLGDICESRLSTLEAFFDLLGLLSRRTLHAYGHWKAWICVAITPLLSLLLIGVSVSLAELVCSSMSQRPLSMHSSLEILRLSGLLGVASISAALAALRVLGRPAIVLMVAAVVAAVECCFRFHITGTPRLCVFLFLLPILFGAWLGLRTGRHLNLLGLTCALLLLCVLGQTSVAGFWVVYQCILLMTPAFYCALADHSRGHHA